MDNIPHRALRHLDGPTIDRITRLLNAICRFSYVPRQWKNPTILSISLLCGVTKILETLLKIEVTDFTTEHKIIPPQQFGFRQNLAAVQQAANFHATAAPKKRWTTLATLLDINKAHDRVWKQGLLHKLRLLKFPLSQVPDQQRPPTGLISITDPFQRVRRWHAYAEGQEHHNFSVCGRQSDSGKRKIPKTEVLHFGMKSALHPSIAIQGKRIKFQKTVTYLGTLKQHVQRTCLAIHRGLQLWPFAKPGSGLTLQLHQRIYT